MVTYPRAWPKGGEVVLALVTTAWAVLLNITGPPGSRPVSGAIVDAAGGISTFVFVLYVLAGLQWFSILIEGWPPRLRMGVAFLVFLWWSFVTAVGVAVAPSSLVWPLLGGTAGLALLQCLDLVGEVARNTDDGTDRDRGGHVGN